MSAFQSRFDLYASPALDRAFGVEVQLLQGVGVSEPFTARWESREYSSEDEEGFETTFTGVDFTFDKASAVIGGQTVKPRGGDRLTLSLNGESHTYEIMPPGQGPAVEEDEAPASVRWRVHTKRITA